MRMAASSQQRSASGAGTDSPAKLAVPAASQIVVRSPVCQVSDKPGRPETLGQPGMTAM